MLERFRTSPREAKRVPQPHENDLRIKGLRGYRWWNRKEQLVEGIIGGGAATAAIIAPVTAPVTVPLAWAMGGMVGFNEVQVRVGDHLEKKIKERKAKRAVSMSAGKEYKLAA